MLLLLGASAAAAQSIANPAYRRQTEAMLNGSLQLSKDPRTLGYDMAWAEGVLAGLPARP